jgi:putative aldouronate transport system substrate-binding protein
MTKTLSVCLVVVLGAALAFAGGGKEGEGATGEVYTLRIVAPGERMPGHDELFQVLNEMSIPEIGIAYDAEFVPWSDFSTRRNLYLQSAEPFDGVLVFEPELQDLWRQRAFQPLNDYISYEQSPTLLEVIPLQVFEDMAIDGEYTNIPSISEYFDFYDSYVIRKDLREKYGMSGPPTDRESFERYLQLVEENEASVIPMRGFPPTGTATKFLDRYTFFIGPEHLGVLNPDTNTISSWGESPVLREFAAMAHRWYENGWIDPDVLQEQNSAQLMHQGRLAAFPHQRRMAGSMMRGDARPPDRTYEQAVIRPDMKPLRTFWGNNIVCVPRSSERPGALIEYLDWVFADRWERYMPFIYGVPGKDWVREGEAIRVGTEQTGERMGGGEGPVLFPQWWFWQAPLLPQDNNWTKEERFYWLQVRDPDVDVVEHPALGFNLDLRAIDTVASKLRDAVSNYHPGIINGVVDPSDPERGISAFQRALEQAGIEEFIAEAQKQWDAYVSQR